MISLFTGLPGNAKTLFALWYIKNKAEKENRKVFYYNVKDLVLPWELFDPQKWFDLPHGSMILIDECQEVFPKKPNGSKLPDYYEQLAKHRHSGYDIFLITQHPSLIDNFVRKLVGQHFHSIRKFGLERSTVYEWSAAVDSPEKASSHKNAVTLKFAFPKEAYTWYKSAEVHTVKRAIPMKVILGVLFVIAVIVGGYYVLDRYQHRYSKSDGVSGGGVAAGGVVTAGSQPNPAAAVSGGPSMRLAIVDPVADARAYVQASTPRIAGLPQTAPKYDELTKPKRVPVPAACLQVGTLQSKNGVRCKCYSQQGTPMPVEINMCLEFARNGFFQEFDADGDRAAQQRTDAGVQALSQRPDAPVPVERQSSTVVAFADAPVPVKAPSPPLTWGH